MSCCLSINGYFEHKIEEGPTGLTIFLIIILTVLGTCAGFVIGVYIPHMYGLMIMSINLAMVVSMLFYSFLQTFTGTWHVLLITAIVLTIVCIYLPMKYET